MNVIRTLTVLFAVIVTGVFTGLTPASAASKTTVAFKGTYTGTASLVIDNSSVKIVAVTGQGSSSLVGAGSISGTGDGTGANGQCVPFTGTGAVKGSAGTIRFVVSPTKSQGCSSGQSGPVTVTVAGVAKVLGGTGKAKGAKGNLAFKGTLKLSNTTGSQSGPFTGRLTGKLTVHK